MNSESKIYTVYDVETKQEIAFDPEDKDLIKVPVLDIPMMSDEQWNQLAWENAKHNLSDAGIEPTLSNSYRYFDELKRTVEYLERNEQPPYHDRNIFPILSLVMDLDGREAAAYEQKYCRTR